MSVINKMLKDLDSRSAEQHNTSSRPYMPEQAKSPTKVILLTVLLMLGLTALAFFVWQMHHENQTLKHQVKNEIAQNKVLKTEQSLAEKNVAKNSAVPVASIDNIQLKPATSISPADEVNTSSLNEQSTMPVVTAAKADAVTMPLEVALSPKTADVISSDEHGHDHPASDIVVSPIANNKNKTDKVSALTISRKQMSPQALAAKKMDKAERALADNKIEQAEQLFEEILLIMPENHTARKQLAALWFGRKSYQPALNLLQQGIVLASNNQEFRLMKARIYLTVGQVEKAYDVLSVLRDAHDIEYQSLLANAAQQIGNHSAAANAYLTLVQLAPQNGRYWLGLAIAYDSNGQFNEATQAYRSALTQGSLSTSAMNFAKQRMEELGE